MSWSAPEFVDNPKDVSWYWISIIVAVIILGISIWQKNFIFAVFIIIAEILVIKWGGHSPRTLKFTLSDKGLNIGDEKFYPMSEFKSFSIEKDDDPESNLDEWADINLFFHSRIKPSLKLQAPHEEAENIEKALSMILPEVDWEPSFFETVERFLKF